jgi:hypothetical protein
MKGLKQRVLSKAAKSEEKTIPISPKPTLLTTTSNQQSASTPAPSPASPIKPLSPTSKQSPTTAQPRKSSIGQVMSQQPSTPPPNEEKGVPKSGAINRYFIFDLL